MRFSPKKVRRHHVPGEVSIKQVHDMAAASDMLRHAGITLPAAAQAGRCFLMAYLGKEAVGIICLETNIDAALMHSLFVVEPMRRRGAGAALVLAARVAAHTRGAQMLYALSPSAVGAYLSRHGFKAVPVDHVTAVFEGTPVGLSCLEPTRCSAFCLDISHDGLIER